MNSSAPKLSERGLKISTIMPLIYVKEAAQKLSKYYPLYDQQDTHNNFRFKPCKKYDYKNKAGHCSNNFKIKIGKCGQSSPIP